MSGDCRGFRQQRRRNRQHNQQVLKVVGEKAEKYSLRLLAEQTSLERSRRDRFNFRGGEMRSDEEFVLRATGENRVKNIGSVFSPVTFQESRGIEVIKRHACAPD